jgi:anti-sigma B factor antagonist
LEWYVIIRQLDRVTVDAAAHPDRAYGARGLLDRVRGAAGKDGGSDVAVMTAERILGLPRTEPRQLELSSRTDGDGSRIVAMTGELDIATAEQAYTYLSDVLDAWETGPVPVSVDLSGLTFCDASGLGVLARIARHAREAGRQLTLTAARPSLLKIMRITGLDRSFPELGRPARAY